jgi:hypothetical protein
LDDRDAAKGQNKKGKADDAADEGNRSERVLKIVGEIAEEFPFNILAKDNGGDYL